LLSRRSFGLFWLAQFMSITGDVFLEVGVMVTIFEQTGSALQTAGVMLAKTIPPFILGPFAGVLADRCPRQRVMVVMDLIRALVVGLLLLVVRQGTVTSWGIYAVVAGLATAMTF